MTEKRQNGEQHSSAEKQHFDACMAREEKARKRVGALLKASEEAQSMAALSELEMAQSLADQADWDSLPKPLQDLAKRYSEAEHYGDIEQAEQALTALEQASLDPIQPQTASLTAVGDKLAKSLGEYGSPKLLEGYRAVEKASKMGDQIGVLTAHEEIQAELKALGILDPEIEPPLEEALPPDLAEAVQQMNMAQTDFDDYQEALIDDKERVALERLQKAQQESLSKSGLGELEKAVAEWEDAKAALAQASEAWSAMA